ncbi:sensor histidine kinase [Methylogaea oryzae]|uniref:sensor histidine kinase n=1 Tax=Methylogaea oryzae TaxID=1295382 RepID=UPI0006D212F2|nr:ATP-binding protein [Methylogaea oryzae]
MSQAPPLDESERAKLEGRARKLAQEKAYLQLVNQLMARISALPGLENLLDNMLQSIVDIIGGTNVMLYYWVDGQLHYADVYGERRQPEAIDDAYVRQVLDTGTPLELEHDVADSQILNPALASAWTWIYPLRVGDEPVGVLKIDNLHVGTREMRQFLPNFFNYAAAVLKNDIFGHTQLKRAYDELKRLNASLAVARDAAEAASRAKSAFLANMSHELRTPLNAILGFAQLMVRENPLDQDGCRRLHAIEHSGQHLMELINDILELSRVEAGHLTLRVEPFDLRALAATVAEMVQLRAQAKGLAVECVCAADIPPRVEGDSHHLRQVLINLLNNAVKYTDRGDVRLSIGWDGRQALFEVTDTGQGISPDDLDKIFDPFYQTATGAAKGEGSGLGLAISRDYVRLMGGELAVESRVGRAAVFTLVCRCARSSPLARTRRYPKRYWVWRWISPCGAFWWPTTTKAAAYVWCNCWSRRGSRRSRRPMARKRWIYSGYGIPISSGSIGICR